MFIDLKAVNAHCESLGILWGRWPKVPLFYFTKHVY